MAKVGDCVRFLNTTGGGIIKRIEGNIAYVDDDGFETPVLVRECVVVNPAPVENPSVAKLHDVVTPKSTGVMSSQSTDNSKPSVIEIEEREGGDKLNIMLAYEPRDIKQLSTTEIDIYLVNDSNYYLSFTYLTADRTGDWNVAYSGIVEPNIQIFLGELVRESLSKLGRVAIQAVPYKLDKEFELKAPVNVELKIDATKFFKLHSFTPNIYFDTPVIGLDIVKDDKPVVRIEPDPVALERAMREKLRDERPRRRVVRKSHPRRDDVIEVDLHINELVDSTRGLSAADMLNLQVDEFRKVMDENLRNHGQRIVFIHGKGEGVLRQALLKELAHRYKGHDVQDASFREYGFGATRVTIK